MKDLESPIEEQVTPIELKFCGESHLTNICSRRSVKATKRPTTTITERGERVTKANTSRIHLQSLTDENMRDSRLASRRAAAGDVPLKKFDEGSLDLE